VGLFGAFATIFIWSSYFVFSRAGVITELTAYDLTALRLMVAGPLMLPFVWSWWPGHLPLGVKLLFAAFGPGALLTVFVALGLTEASAAYGGVFSNGALPIFTMLLVFVFSGVPPSRRQLFAVAVIILGGVLLAYRGMTSGGQNVGLGIALFLVSSALISVYIYGVQRWQLTPRQALAIVVVPNAVIYLPIWYFLLPSGIADAEFSTVLFQALFQGLGPGILAVVMFALAAYHLGPTVTAGFSAVVPATATLLAIPVLGEIPSPFEWAGIAMATLGLTLLMRSR